jgi:hypothetical protein
MTRPRKSACSSSAAKFRKNLGAASSPLAALLKDEIARWSPIIKAAAVKSE